jgi:hypothetical protein
MSRDSLITLRLLLATPSQESVSSLDDTCVELAEQMLANARDHATLASLGCFVDTCGAIFAVRSKELFNYEEIASQHAEVSRAQPL